MRGDTSADQPLQPGDVIFVPVVEKQITISGAVRRPAKYEIIDNETLKSAIDLAGGARDRSVLDIIRLERIDSNFRLVVKNLNLSNDYSYTVMAGDQISLGYVGNTIRNRVSIIGAAENVGDYEWKSELVLQDIINDPLDLLPNADFEYGLIRRTEANGDFHCLSFVPSDLFISNKSKKLSLEKQDLIYFFTRDSREEILEGLIKDLRKQSNVGKYSQLIRISGSVHYPGEYPFTKSMILGDLFRAAGGPKDSAYMLDAEVTRIGINQENTATVEHLRIPSKMLSDSNQSAFFKLQPYDSVSIKPIPLWKEGESIEINGEVKFPGIYSIKVGESLFEVLQRAGGLTSRAFSDGAIFSRENLRLNEDEQRERLIAQLESDLATATLASQNNEEAAQAQSAARAMLSRLKNTKSQGRLVIDLASIIQNEEKSKLLVKDGDQLLYLRYLTL